MTLIVISFTFSKFACLVIFFLEGFHSASLEKFDVRMRGGPKVSEGRVEVLVNGLWGNICVDDWDLKDAEVVCRQLGYPLGALEATKGWRYGIGSGDYVLCGMICFGNESSIGQCGLGFPPCSRCVRGESAGIMCREYKKTCTENYYKCRNDKCVEYSYVCDGSDDCTDGSDETTSLCKEPEIRLVGGNDNYSGRVEIKFLGMWGTICDDKFDDEDAAVICHSLGFRGLATAHGNAFFGAGRGIIWLDELQCNGWESNIIRCPRGRWARHNCRHSEDAGVTCSSTIGQKLVEPVECGVESGEEKTPNYEFIRSPGSYSVRLKEINRMSSSLQDGLSTTLHVKHRVSRMVFSEEMTSLATFPWIADIRFHAEGQSRHSCGGAILSEFFVITAAHCLDEHTIRDYIVRVGEFDQNRKDPFEEDFEIEKIIIHEDFQKDVRLNNDIALVKVKPKAGRGIQFSTDVRPICLPSPEIPYLPMIRATIAGWGVTENKTKSSVLRLAHVPLLSNAQCKGFTDYGTEKLRPGMLCAGHIEGGSDACQADSGGPLVARINGRSILFGVVSWGYGCGGAKRPSVYVNIQHYLEWITKNMAA